MPDPNEKLSESVHVRLYEGSTAEIDAVAAVEQRKRGDMLRLLITEGLKTYKRRHEMRR